MEYLIAENLKRNPKLKPTVKLIGQNGNIFNLMALCRKPLKAMPNAFNEMQQRIFASHSYEEALSIISDYIDIE